MEMLFVLFIVVLAVITRIVVVKKATKATQESYIGDGGYYDDDYSDDYYDGDYSGDYKEQEITTKIVGVTHKSSDRSSRQRHIEKCKRGDYLFFRHDPKNEYDNCAIEVYREHKGLLGTSYHQIGFLGRHLAPRIVEHMENGGQAGAYIEDITGGTYSKPTRGVNIRIILT